MSKRPPGQDDITETSPDKLPADSATVTSISTHYRNANKAKARKERDDLVAFAILGFDADMDKVFGVAASGNDKKSETEFGLLSRIKQVGSFLTATSVPVFLGLTGLKAAEIAGDAKRLAARNAEKAAAKATVETVAKEGAEATAKQGTKTAVTTLAREGAETAAETGSKILATDVAKWSAKGLKKVPLVGAVITGGFVAAEVGSFIANGEGKKALAATFAGFAEMGGNILGFGVGDAAREGARGLVIKKYGDDYADVWKSDIRMLIETGIELKNEYNGAAAGADEVDPAAPTHGKKVTFAPQLAPAA